MSAEIIAKLGLNSARFQQGLTEAERGWEAFGQKLRSKPIEVVPSKSARDSARVFEDIERQRQEHIGALDRDRIERSLGGGTSGKSAADSARVFEEQAQAQESLAVTRRRIAYDEANTVGRIRIIQRDLVSLAKQRNTLQEGSVARLRTEQQIAERMAQLRGLQRTQQLSNLLPSVAAVEQRANGILAMLRRKFGAADALKGLLGGLGAGGIGALAGSLTSLFSRQAERAQGAEQLSAGNFENMKNTLGTIGGMQAKVRLARREFDDLGIQIEMTQRTLKELEGNPLNLIHPLWQSQVDKLQSELNQLLGNQNAVGNEFTILSRDLQYQNDLYEQQISSIEQLNRARLRGMTDLQIADKTLLGLEIQLGIARINKRPQEEQRAITLEIRRQQGAVAQMVRDMRNARSELAGNVTGQVLGNRRTFSNGAQRPRTETERLADRASRERQQATDAIITGQPQLARDSLRSARRSESAVLSRVSSASRMVSQDQKASDPGLLKNALTDTNTILKRIDQSLTKTNVKGGPKGSK